MTVFRKLQDKKSIGWCTASPNLPLTMTHHNAQPSSYMIEMIG